MNGKFETTIYLTQAYFVVSTTLSSLLFPHNFLGPYLISPRAIQVLLQPTPTMAPTL